MVFVEEHEVVLTEDQDERIKMNRERAVRLRMKRELEVNALPADDENEQNRSKRVNPLRGETMGQKFAFAPENKKEVQLACSGVSSSKEEHCNTGGITEEGCGEEDNDVLESFEVGSTPMVTKKEAMSVYCLPEGTLAVCECVEKENPYRKGWSTMKLYHRSEIRRRARERHGGIEGLSAERKSREMKRCANIMEKTKDIFKKNK